MIAYRLQVEATRCERAENAVVERVPQGCVGVHCISSESLSLTVQSGQGVIFRSFAFCGNRVPVETSHSFIELRSNGCSYDDDSEVKAYIRLPVPLLMLSQHEDRSSRPRVGYVQKRSCKEPHMTVTSCTGAAGILRRGKLDLYPCLVLAQSWSRRPRPRANDARLVRGDEVPNKHVARASRGTFFC